MVLAMQLKMFIIICMIKVKVNPNPTRKWKKKQYGGNIIKSNVSSCFILFLIVVT